MDISNNPGILSTLYQRGTSEKAARDFVIRRNTNPYATPEARDMGIWVEKNSKYITNVIKGDKNWPSASHNLFNMIKTGMQGSGILGLQAMLNKQGAGLKVDGIFGPKTNTAVKQFQQSRGLVVDGKVGPKTWAAFNTPVRKVKFLG